MSGKYLPIGSVCTLKGKNKKVMITGYYSVEFNGNLNIKDYLGCVYPEGMLLPNQNCTFNHKDIEKVDFVGFKNDELRTFMNLFDRLTANDKNLEQDAAEFHKENDMILTSSKSYSKLLFDENGVVMIAEPVKTEIDPKVANPHNIKFDKDGYVVSVGDTNEVDNPFYKDYNTQEINDEKDPSKWSIFNNFKFDENGVVVSEETYKFDKDGVLVSVDEKIHNGESEVDNKTDEIEATEQSETSETTEVETEEN